LLNVESPWSFLPVLLLAAGCGDDPKQQPAPLTGPPGGMIEADGGLRGSSGGTGSGGTSWGGSGGVLGNGGSGGGQLLNGGLGKVCSSDTDCPAGLTCHLDPVDWIAHRQCSTSCDSSEACEAKFGSHTMCIGAHLCVSKCLDDTDCPPTTTCNSNDWCENSGPGSGVPKCTGVPTPCSLLDQFDCTSALGCRWDGRCNGVSESCYLQYDSYSCNNLDGCYWSSSSSSCSGISTSCSGFSSEFLCTDQDGCSWRGDCTGTPLETSCSDIAPALCDYTPGCVLAPQ